MHDDEPMDEDHANAEEEEPHVFGSDFYGSDYQDADFPGFEAEDDDNDLDYQLD